MHVTQKEIADQLGVSRQLVTYALSGGGTVSNQKRREVLEAAERMGYRRNELARAMVTGRSRTLGILTSHDPNEAHAKTIAGALGEAAEHGYATKLLFLPFYVEEAEAQTVIQLCSTWRLDGVLVIGLSDQHLEMLHTEMSQGNRPIGFVGNIVPEGSIGAYSDDTHAWRLAIRHLVDLGHRRIAHLGARPTSKLACIRLKSWLGVMREFGLTVDEHSAAMTSWRDVELIEQGAERLLTAPTRPTALLCAGDGIALCAMRVARRMGLSVPKDLSVVGFGSHADSIYADPALTTIKQPHEEVARQAMRQVLSQVEKGPEDNTPRPCPFNVTTGFELIVRDSTAPSS